MGKSLYIREMELIRKIFAYEITKKLTPKTLQSFLHSLKLPMKWSFLHGMTEISCNDGIITPVIKSREKVILTTEETMALLNTT